MKGCGPKHFCFSALRAWSSTLAAWKRNRLPPRKMTAQRSWLFPLNNSNLLWKSNPKYHLHWLNLDNFCSEKRTIWIFHSRYTNKQTSPPPINQGTFSMWVNWKRKLLMNTMLLEMRILKWHYGYCRTTGQNTILHESVKCIWLFRHGCTWPVWS